MSPDVDAALRTIMMTLVTEIGPQVSGDYPKASVNMLAAASLFMAEEYDRAVEVRVWENATMRRLFVSHASAIVDSDLAERLGRAGAGLDESLRVSALRTSNAELKRLLIELQATLEVTPGDASRRAQAEIVAFLRASAERKALHFM